MRRRASRIAALAAGLAGLLPAPAPLAAQDGRATAEGAVFLLLPVGARATALGQAVTAEGGTSEALFWNPAGLAALAASEFAVHHFRAVAGTGDVVALGVPTQRFGTLAVAAYLVNYGDLDVTRAVGGPEPVGRISPRNLMLLMSYATQIVGGLDAGLSYKLIQFRVDCSGDCRDVITAVGTTHAVDVGLRYVPGSSVPIALGVSLRNAGFKLQVENRAQADVLPTRLQVGVSYEVVQSRSAVPGLDVRVHADVADGLGSTAGAPEALLGIESGLGDVVRLRAGYAFLNSDARGPSLGLGMRVGNVAFDLARAFFTQDDLNEREPIHFSFRLIF